MLLLFRKSSTKRGLRYLRKALHALFCDILKKIVLKGANNYYTLMETYIMCSSNTMLKAYHSLFFKIVVKIVKVLPKEIKNQ